MAKSKICKRCKNPFLFGYQKHVTIGQCLLQAQSEGRNSADDQHATEKKLFETTVIEHSRYSQEKDKIIKELNGMLQAKAAEERPMSEMEMMSLTMVALLDQMRNPYRHVSQGPSKHEDKVRAELKRRGLL